MDAMEEQLMLELGPLNVSGMYIQLMQNMVSQGTLTNALQYNRRLAGHHKRVQYLGLLLHMGFVLPVYYRPRSKLSSLANSHLAAGNSSYEREDFHMALHDYGRAVACAPLYSLEMAAAYDGRSGTLMALGQPLVAMGDIQRAADIYNRHPVERDMSRKFKICIGSHIENRKNKYVTHDNSRESILRPLTNRHPNIPCASDKLDFCDLPPGRKIVTTSEVKPGDILAVENPFVYILFRTSYYTHCYNCLRKSYSLVPCDTCNEIMFCSVECKIIAINGVHRYECPLMFYLKSELFMDTDLLGFRVVLEARVREGSWRAVREAIEKAEDRDYFPWKGFEEVDGTNIYDSAHFASVHTLDTRYKWRSNQDVMKKSLVSAVFLDLLATYTDIFDDEDFACIEYVGGILLHHVMTAEINACTITTVVKSASDNTTKLENFACGIYPFRGLIRHSCDPNVTIVYVGTKAFVLCLQSIKKGDEIFESYGPYYASDDIQTRFLELDLSFKTRHNCNCHACLNHWKTYYDLPLALSHTGISETDFAYDKILWNSLIMRENTDGHDGIARVSDQIYKYIAVLEKHKPNRELCELQLTLVQNWRLLGNIFFIE